MNATIKRHVGRKVLAIMLTAVMALDVMPSAAPLTAQAATAGTVNRTSDTQATIAFTTNQSGAAYYLAVESGATPPTSADVKANGAALGAVTAGAVSGLSVPLTVGAKDIYIVVEDVLGNISAPFKIEAAAYAFPFSGGDGTSESPFLISDAAELDAARDYLDKRFKLVNDIDLTAYLAIGGADYAKWNTAGWKPIGAEGVPGNWNRDAFKGSFDGDGHKITGLWIKLPDAASVGLFGYTDGATIKNLGVETASAGVAGRGYKTGLESGVGILVGNSQNSTITDCYITGSVTGVVSVGGLIGLSRNGAITGCHSTAGVTAASSSYGSSYSFGGLVGYADATAINNCYATGNVVGYNVVGGLAGAVDNANISNCYATGNVSATAYYPEAGGFAGINGGAISYCYAAGNVSGAEEGYGAAIGGLAGLNVGVIKNSVAANGSIIAPKSTTDINRIANNYSSSYTYNNNYANSAMSITVNGSTVSRNDDAAVNGAGKTLAELKAQSFYTTAGNWGDGAWDFTDIWKIAEGVSLPVFKRKPLLFADSVSRASDAAATVKVTSGEAGTYYYQIGGTAPTAWAHTLYIAAKDAAGDVSNLLTVMIPEYAAPTPDPQ